MFLIIKRLWQVNWAEQWQYRANLLMYRTDKVTPAPDSWSAVFDDASKYAVEALSDALRLRTLTTWLRLASATAPRSDRPVNSGSM